MNRFRIERSSLLNGGQGDDDDEEKLYERQALIEDDELHNNDDSNNNNPLGIRQRQNISRVKSYDNYITDNHELKTINKNRDLMNDPNLEYTFYDIAPQDTLQSICLRFNLQIDQIKRINGLINDQEFYGLRRLRLPLGKFGFLEDILKKSQQTNANSTTIVTNIIDNPISELAQTSTNQQAPLSSRITSINSPGSALSVSVRNSPIFKPLLSPGFSSDRISDLNSKNNHTTNSNGYFRGYNNHSHSFSSLREFANNDNHTNIDIDVKNHDYVATRHVEQNKTFIKSEFNNYEYDENVETDDILMIGNDNVGKVFEELDYHVERAKASAEKYDQRAAELVSRIDTNNQGIVMKNLKKSRIPELFYCNENFGLSYKKLLIFIFVVCLLIPLIYINQTTTNHNSTINQLEHLNVQELDKSIDT